MHDAGRAPPGWDGGCGAGVTHGRCTVRLHCGDIVCACIVKMNGTSLKMDYCSIEDSDHFYISFKIFIWDYRFFRRGEDFLI